MFKVLQQIALCQYYKTSNLQYIIYSNFKKQLYKKYTKISMKKLFILIILLHLLITISTQENKIKISDKILEFVPQIRKDYSITYTEIYPPEKHQPKQENTPTQPIANSNSLKSKNLHQGNNRRNELRRAVNNNQPQLIEINANQVKHMPQLFPSQQNKQMLNFPQIKKSIQFEKFHEIQFKANKKFILNNIDDQSILNEAGKVIKLDTPTTEKKQQTQTEKIEQIIQLPKRQDKPTIDQTKVIPMLPIQPQTNLPRNTPTSIQTQTSNGQKALSQTTHISEQKIKQISNIIQRKDKTVQADEFIKILYTILLGFAIILVVFFHKPSDKHKRTKIPTTDDEQNTLR